MRRLIIIIVALQCFVALNAQDVNIRSWLDTSRIYIGDQINYNIEIEHPADIELRLPLYKDTLIGGIEIISVAGPDTSIVDNISTISLSYLITCFDTGTYEIEPAKVESINKSGYKRDYSDYSHLEVVRVGITPSDSTDVIFDIIGPRKAGVTIMEIVPWVLLAIALSLLTWFLLRYFKKQDKEEPEDKGSLPEEPYHIIAFRELDKLEREELWQKSKHKHYYSRLTETLRTYIDSQFGIGCMEMTSSETLSELRQVTAIGKEHYAKIESLLRLADLSKFAKFKASEEDNTNAMADARYFVKEVANTLSGEQSDNTEEIKEEEEAGDE